MIRTLEYLVEVFIQGFGITKPSDEQRRRVAIVLGSVLLAGILLVIVIAVSMVLYLHTSH